MALLDQVIIEPCESLGPTCTSGRNIAICHHRRSATIGKYVLRISVAALTGLLSGVTSN